MASFGSLWFGYAALALLLLASLGARVSALGLGLVGAALLAAMPALALGPDVIALMLLGLIAAANMLLLVRGWLDEGRPVFSPEEEAMRRAHLAQLSPDAARRLIDQGEWISARRGQLLIRDGEAAPGLFYIAEGDAAMVRDGKDAGLIAEGALIGEAMLLEGGASRAELTLARDARLWFIPATMLRTYLAANPDVAARLHEGFARALRGKLSSSNARLSERGPLS
ncbi:Crp/Fnr family transcriptional regulator [Sphingopyxis sp. MWB1]|uniref:Crp/Fnr family transcriptional regulator n=1 Tax=Sphingopyxis sp. MWB1 TaxID=1537715 RepID=UPI00051A3879|nr:cyclic nucleotide-binding domain-containing protein [Sphingopyxis sp. MWB1]